MQLADDTGASETDSYTSDPTVAGTGDPNAVVHFVIDGVAQEATVTADSSGAWSYTPGLDDGVHKIVASETNSLDLTGSASVTFNLDTIPPPVAVFLVDDSGPSRFDGNTNDASLQGGGQANTEVDIFEDGLFLGSTVSDETGGWTFAPPELPDGPHRLVAQETDLAGNVGEASLTFILDTEAPEFSIRLANDTGVSNEDSLTNDPTLTGTGEPGAKIVFYEGEGRLGETTVGSDGSWTFTPPLADGRHTIFARASDLAGNSTTGSVSFDLDTESPTLTVALAYDRGISSYDGLTNDLSLTGSAEPHSLIAVFDGSTNIGATQANADGAWFLPVSERPDGVHKIKAVTSDAAGNQSEASLVAKLDTDPPYIFISSGDGSVFSPYQLISGYGEAGASYALFDNGDRIAETGTIGADGAWSQWIDLIDGPNELMAEATDKAGNVTQSNSVVLTASYYDSRT
jgi:hypothetical protein